MTPTPQEIARDMVIELETRMYDDEWLAPSTSDYLELQIAAAIEQARRDAIAEAAKVCDAEAKSERRWMLDYEKAFGPDDARVTECSGGWAAAKTLAREIRSLAGKGDRHE